MLLESAFSLKAELLEKIIDPYAAAVSGYSSVSRAASKMEAEFQKLDLHPLAISASAIKPAPHRSVALGIAGHGKKFRLALRVQRLSLMNSPLVERLTKAARGEVDLRLVGPIEKRAKKVAGIHRATNKSRVKPLALSPWYQTNVRPLLIGASIAHKSVTAGTLGAFVGKGGKVFVLSNNHVLANENQAQIGDAVLQRSPYDGGKETSDRIGDLAQWIPLTVNTSNAVDAAIAEVKSTAWDASLLQGLPIGGNSKLRGVATAGPVGNAIVYKLGRTTGPTQGRISAFDLSNVVVGYGIGNIRFDGVVEIESMGTNHFSDGGDSGALVVNESMEAVALLFAGSDSGGTYATPIDVVFDAFGVDLLL